MSQEITLQSIENAVEKVVGNVVNKRFNNIDQRLDSVELKMEQKFDGLTETVLDSFDENYKKLDSLTETIIDSFDEVHTKFDQKFEDLTEIIVEGFDTLHQEIVHVKTKVL